MFSIKNNLTNTKKFAKYLVMFADESTTILFFFYFLRN